MNTPQSNLPEHARGSPAVDPETKPAAPVSTLDRPKHDRPADAPRPTAGRADSDRRPLPKPQQMQQTRSSTDALRGRWQQVLGAAKVTWGKLTDDELMKLDGHEQRLAGLVQERYAITREVADQQARSFFAQHMT